MSNTKTSATNVCKRRMTTTPYTARSEIRGLHPSQSTGRSARRSAAGRPGPQALPRTTIQPRESPAVSIFSVAARPLASVPFGGGRRAVAKPPVWRPRGTRPGTAAGGPKVREIQALQPARGGLPGSPKGSVLTRLSLTWRAREFILSGRQQVSISNRGFHLKPRARAFPPRHFCLGRNASGSVRRRAVAVMLGWLPNYSSPEQNLAPRMRSARRTGESSLVGKR